MRKHSMVRGVVIGLLVALVSAGTAWAFWASSYSQAGATILDGDLRITEGTSVSWAETTENLRPDQRRSGTGFDSLKSFVGVPGDQVEVSYPVSTVLSGENLKAALRVSYADANQVLPQGVDLAGYYVRDAEDNIAAPETGLLGIGEAARPAVLEQQGGTSLKVVLVLRWTGNAASIGYATDPADFANATPATLAGIPIRISLEQMR